jgi:hypothetical protein
MRSIQIDMAEILSLVHCAGDYGFAKSILLSAFAGMTGFVTDAEILEYSQTFQTPEMQSQGYTSEDVDSALETVTEWRDRYCEDSTNDN